MLLNVFNCILLFGWGRGSGEASPDDWDGGGQDNARGREGCYHFLRLLFTSSAPGYLLIEFWLRTAERRDEKEINR